MPTLPAFPRAVPALGLVLLLTACADTPVPGLAAALPATLRPLAAPTGGQTYAVLSACTRKGLAVQDAATGDGAAVVQWTYNAGTHQQWTLQATDGGFFRVAARHSGRVLDVSNAATTNSSPVAQWAYWGGRNQQWRFEAVGNDLYEIAPRHAPALRLDVRGASVANGARIQLYADNNSCAQRWTFQPVASTPAPTPVPPPTPAPTPAPKVMPLGDSITDGYNVPGGYRVELFRKLSATAPGVNFVGSLVNGPATLGDRDHEGHSGWRIDEIAARVNGWLDTHQPATVLLMIGTNDVLQNRDPANAPARLGALLDQMSARRPNMRVLVASLPPLANTGQNAWVQRYNAALPALVQARATAGQRVTLVDAASALTLADLADGVHPNSGGYAKLADVWHRALVSTPGALTP